MGMITINTQINAPSCPCEIVSQEMIDLQKLQQQTYERELEDYREDKRIGYPTSKPVKPQKIRTSILIQAEGDYCGTANSFGWSLTAVQLCRECSKAIDVTKEEPGPVECDSCGFTIEQPLLFGDAEDFRLDRKKANVFCEHDGTDGTVRCEHCDAPVSAFSSAAYDFLTENDGLTAEDPGYFSKIILENET